MTPSVVQLKSTPRTDYTVTLTDSNGDSTEIAVDGAAIMIGKANDCAVRLAGWRVGREHARVLRTPEGLILEDLGQFSGTWVNGSRVVRHGPLTFADQIQIAGYKLRVQDSPHRPAMPHEVAHEVVTEVAPEASYVLATAPVQADVGAPAAAQNTVKQLHEKLPAGGIANASERAKILLVQARHPWRKRLHDQLLDKIDLRRRDLTRMSDAELRIETEHLVRQILDSLTDLPATIDRAELSKEVLNEAIGLGPLEELLADDSVTEIMVNRHDEIFVERAGRLTWYPLSFTSDRAVMGVIERIVAPLGRRIDESSPMVDARLKDGSRVNAIIPPLALKGPTITIRKFPKKRLIDPALNY